MEYRIPIGSEPDATRAVMQARRSAAAVGFDQVRVTMIATAASELVRNILKYAGAGELIIRHLDAPTRQGIELVAADKGPGIADIPHALRDHTSTGGTLGLGLPGVKRMMDELTVQSAPGQGTTVTARMWTS
jgi:serine/threonine-protein kinase RsbT